LLASSLAQRKIFIFFSFGGFLQGGIGVFVWGGGGVLFWFGGGSGLCLYREVMLRKSKTLRKNQ